MNRRQTTIDACGLALQMTTASLAASLQVGASTVRAVKGGAKAQRAIGSSWRAAMVGLGREYVRQMRDPATPVAE